MCFFFFKQKTAYEMRISDWSSDVCSSDLKRWVTFERVMRPPLRLGNRMLSPAGSPMWRRQDLMSAAVGRQSGTCCAAIMMRLRVNQDENDLASLWRSEGVARKIERASCRERGCQYG